MFANYLAARRLKKLDDLVRKIGTGEAMAHLLDDLTVQRYLYSHGWGKSAPPPVTDASGGPSPPKPPPGPAPPAPDPGPI